MKHSRIGLASTALAAALLCVLPTAAQADTPDALPDAVVQELKAFWSDNDVNASVQRELVTGIENGKLPLSLVPTTKPVERTATVVNGFNRTTETFADGSIRLAEVQTVDGYIAEPHDFEATPMAAPTASISGCRISSGSGYSNYDNCLVRGTTGAVTNWFYASWTYVQGAYNDQLRSTSNPGQTCNWPYSCTIPSRSAFVGQERSWTAAGATYTGTANTGTSSQTTYLNLEIKANGSRAWFTMP